MESVFGLQSKYDKELLVSYEITDKFPKALSDDLFKQMVCGEDVNVPRKYKSSISVPWRTPIYLCGNTFPSYKDVQGSISRRLAIFRFENYVEKKDSTLEENIRQKELPALIGKCLKWYHILVQYVGTCSFWEVCPEYFSDSLDELRHEVDYIHMFLTQDVDENIWARGGFYFQRVEGESMLLSDFKKKFNTWIWFNHHIRYKWTSDYSSFKRLGYSVEKIQTCKACMKTGGNCCPNYNRHNRSMKYVINNLRCVELNAEL